VGNSGTAELGSHGKAHAGSHAGGTSGIRCNRPVRNDHTGSGHDIA
jgi:hypothetical protein